MNCLGYVVTERLQTSTPSSYAPHQPRKLVLLGDTCDSRSLSSFSQHASLLIHEATFLDQDVEHAQRTGHSTTGMAGQWAKEIQAQHLCLTHFSQRYLQKEMATGVVDLQALEHHRSQAQQAAGESTKVHLAQDFLTLHIMPQGVSATPSTEQPHVETASPEIQSTKFNLRSTPDPTKAAAAPSSSQRQPLHILMPKKIRR